MAAAGSSASFSGPYSYRATRILSLVVFEHDGGCVLSSFCLRFCLCHPVWRRLLSCPVWILSWLAIYDLYCSIVLGLLKISGLQSPCQMGLRLVCALYWWCMYLTGLLWRYTIHLYSPCASRILSEQALWMNLTQMRHVAGGQYGPHHQHPSVVPGACSCISGSYTINVSLQWVSQLKPFWAPCIPPDSVL